MCSSITRCTSRIVKWDTTAASAGVRVSIGAFIATSASDYIKSSAASEGIYPEVGPMDPGMGQHERIVLCGRKHFVPEISKYGLQEALNSFVSVLQHLPSAP